jgi:hypothetical protein
MEFYLSVGQECMSLAMLSVQARHECIDYAVTQMMKNRNYQQINKLTDLVQDDLIAQDTYLNGLAAALFQQAPNVSNELVETIRLLELKKEFQELVLDALLEVHREKVNLMSEPITILGEQNAIPTDEFTEFTFEITSAVAKALLDAEPSASIAGLSRN